MNFILVIYTVVATISAGSSSTATYDWRPIGSFGSNASCEAAAMKMGYKNIERPLYRCLDSR